MIQSAHTFCWEAGMCTASAIDPEPHHGSVCRSMRDRDAELWSLLNDWLTDCSDTRARAYKTATFIAALLPARPAHTERT